MIPKSTPDGEAEYLSELIANLTIGANGEDAQLKAFLAAFEDGFELPSAATIAGKKVTVVKFGYDGNARRGLTADCRGNDGIVHVVSGADVVIPLEKQNGRYLAAYRKWLGIDPFPPGTRTTPKERPGALAIQLDAPLELIVLSVMEKAARCQILGTGQTITFRAASLWKLVPGAIATVDPSKQWTYGGTPYLSGKIAATRCDPHALGLPLLKLTKCGVWDPADCEWGQEGEPIEEWARPIIAWGKRPEYEMEQILPGLKPGDYDSDPIGQSNDLKDIGDYDGAYKILMNCCEADLRCLDAHAHLGIFLFKSRPEDAIRNYEVGYRIGELTLGSNFDGLLPWGWIDNRPFLRCMHGYALCLWRLKRFQEAAEVFERMLWLNPSDNQGARFSIDQARAKTNWTPDE